MHFEIYSKLGMCSCAHCTLLNMICNMHYKYALHLIQCLSEFRVVKCRYMKCMRVRMLDGIP